MLSNQYPFQVHNLNEYFADIDTTLQIIKQEGNHEILLMGHFNNLSFLSQIQKSAPRPRTNFEQPVS